MTLVYCAYFSFPLTLKRCASCLGHRFAVCLKARHSVGKQACNIIFKKLSSYIVANAITSTKTA